MHGWSVVHEHFYSSKLNVYITEGAQFSDWVSQKQFDDGSSSAGMGESHSQQLS